jgi:hypothetical protein
MARSLIVASLTLLALAAPALAQESGGLALDPSIKDGPHGLARPLQFTRPPYMTAHDLQNGMTPADHQAQDQAMITRLRGDPGFLAGFSMGTPLAASRQPQQTVPYDGGYWYRHTHGGHGQGPIIINNQGPLALTVGNGNVVQQQSATGSGPIAQQQVATTPATGSHGSGALNLVTGGGNILQRAPGGS